MASQVDPTVEIRQKMLADGIKIPEGAETWDTERLQQEYDVEGFLAPVVVVRRKSDGVLGTMLFTDQPRVYFGWEEDVE